MCVEIAKFYIMHQDKVKEFMKNEFKVIFNFIIMCAEINIT